jgi:hypothetical protein
MKRKTDTVRQIIHTTVFGLLALTLPLGCKSQNLDGKSSAAAHSQLANDMIGTWVRVGTPGHVGAAPSMGGYLKVRTGSNWVITQADKMGWLVATNSGGTYTLNGNEYVETQEYANATWTKDNGKSFKFTVKIEGDTMTQIGVDNPYSEVWKRVK